MKKKVVSLGAAFLIVFGVSGSAFAGPMTGAHNNYNLQTRYRGGIHQSVQYGTNGSHTTFRDVAQNYWAYSSINNMRNLGVISGDSNGNFNPGSQVTRAEFATMLVKGLKLPLNQGATQTYTDVLTNNWAYPYIEAAHNYLTGYQNSNGQSYYSLQSPATREDVIVSLIKALGLENETPDLSALSNFADANQIPANLRGYMAIAIKHGLVNGSLQSGECLLNPRGRLTRAEAAALLDKILQNNNGQQTVNQQGPVLTSATASGATVTLTYNESLDQNYVPNASDFTVYVDGTAQAAPTGVAISGSTVNLSLNQAIPAGSTVTVNYTPSAYPLRDLSGYATPAFVNCQVTNNQDTTPPVWQQGSALNVSNLSATGLTLAWTQATDNVGVTAYRIYQDGNLLTVVTGSTFSYNITGLSADTTHTFRVDAGDVAGNWSAGSSLSVTTTNS